MPQLKKAFEEARVAFSKMTFSPDVPSSALGPNEYNSGVNVEADIRGIRSVNGDEVILPYVPGTPTFVSSGFRQPIPGYTNDYWFIVATDEGYWYACNGEGDWIDITPVEGPFTTYNQATNITEAWNGTVPFFNDESNPPMFWSEFTGVSFPVDTISGDGSTVTVTFDNQADEITGAQIVGHRGEFVYTNAAPLKVGQKVTISGVNTNLQNYKTPFVDIIDLNGGIECANLLAPAFFSADVSGTTLNITTVGSGNIIVGMRITGPSIPDDTFIISALSGTGGAGTYELSDDLGTIPTENMSGKRDFGLLVGQTITVVGSNTNTDITLSNVKIVSNTGDFSCNAIGSEFTPGSIVEISGSISSSPQTLGTISINSIDGSFSCASASLAAGQTVTVSGTITNTDTVLNTVRSVGSTGQFTCAATSLQVGQVVRVEGVPTVTETYLTGVQITGTGGQFSCTATTLYPGQIIQVSGANTGTGSITGYVDPTIYKISTTNGSTTFTLVTLLDEALVTTAGTVTGTTWTVAPQSIANYNNPTEYYISATDGSTTFTLKNLNGSTVLTNGGDVDPLVFTVLAPQIVDYTNPTEYLIGTTNGSTIFTLTKVDGTAISTRGGIPTGLTFTVLVPQIDGYTDPTEYIVGSTNGTTRFKLYNIITDPLTGLLVPGAPLSTNGGTPTGMTFVKKKPEIIGWYDGIRYYVSETNGTTRYRLVDGDGNPIQTRGGSVLPSLGFRVLHPRIYGYTDPTTYYIIATNGIDNFQLSSTPAGTPIQTDAGVREGNVFTYTPFAIGEEISITGVVPTAYRGNYTVTDCGSDFVEYSDTESGAQLRGGAISARLPQMTMYSNKLPLDIYDIVYDDFNTMKIILSATQTEAPYIAGEYIILSGINSNFNGTYKVHSSTTDTITYYATPASNYPAVNTGIVSPKYSWNYNPNWQSVYAKWMRLYNTPNVGCILVAGGLTATDLDGTVFEYPVTIQWSQAFGLNDAPLTWEPTVTNVAQQLEVPLRGQALDAFPANGQMFICSYWDTVVLSPLNYTTTSAPILGVKLVNQGRGILSSNCWTNTDKMVYGVDARDIWAFDGANFVGIGNQRVKNWFYQQFDSQYVDRIFMDNNTSKNQIEIYYPTKVPVISSVVIDSTDGWFICDTLTRNGGILRNGLELRLSGINQGPGSIAGYTGDPKTYWVIDTNGVDRFQISESRYGDPVSSTVGQMRNVNYEFVSDGVPNMMLSYRYDIDCWNAPREVQSATMTCEAPVAESRQWYYNIAGTTTGGGVDGHFNILRDATLYDGYPTPNVRGTGYTVGDTITVSGTLLGGESPANDCVITVTRTDGPGRIAEATFEGTPLDTWIYDLGKRTLVYARGIPDRSIVQKDQGYNFLGPQQREYAINSRFRRDNIKIVPDYSNKVLVHRILPEVNNLNKFNVPIDPIDEYKLIGEVSIKVEGSESVGQVPQETTAITMRTDTSYPWVQMNQNAHRVNSLEISNSSADQIWICNSTTWQYTPTEDDR